MEAYALGRPLPDIIIRGYMAEKIDFSVATSSQIETALCRRLERIRLMRNITQAELAEEAGVSLRTIGRLEQGQGVSLDTFIRVLTALHIQQNLEGLLPDPSIRPMERIDSSGSERRRARKKRTSKQDSNWSWGDDG